jgi:hypothetical protein
MTEEQRIELLRILERVRDYERSINWDAAGDMNTAELIARLNFHLDEAGFRTYAEIYPGEFDDDEPEEPDPALAEHKHIKEQAAAFFAANR